MERIIEDMRLEKVERILVSGSGLLDFEIADSEEYYVWDGTEDAEWKIEDTSTVVNYQNEDRIAVYPEGDYFICDIQATGEERNSGPVRCWSRSR